jgi:hypothetical protein
MTAPPPMPSRPANRPAAAPTAAKAMAAVVSSRGVRLRVAESLRIQWERDEGVAA